VDVRDAESLFPIDLLGYSRQELIEEHPQLVVNNR
jgi:hypothetical protein